MGIKYLKEAKRNKNDEFYTQLSDIYKELNHYGHLFKDKTILCNCDNPYESNFFKYFAMKFYTLGLKKLITTSYIGSSIAYSQLTFDDLFGFEKSKTSPTKDAHPPYKSMMTEIVDENNDGAICLRDAEAMLRKKKNITLLDGDGDFRSEECIELLKQTDIVVTNPPFSLFREYVVQLIE
jgi:hypothetical protein